MINGHLDHRVGDGHLGEASHPGPTFPDIGEKNILDGGKLVGETFALAWGACAAFCRSLSTCQVHFQFLIQIQIQISFL